ncbi:MAG: hypothetical protein KGQ95_01965 [Acidobacteria bacterium]|nr:hypothetical protein [Acidobacteriota bacterium]
MAPSAEDANPWRESRWPPLAALFVAAVLEVTLPGDLILGGGWIRWIIPALVAVLIVISAVSPVEETDRRRRIGVTVAALVTLANAGAIGELVYGIVSEAGFEGKYLIVAALQVWFTNMIVFAVWFWEIDGGGPRHRALAPPGPHEYLFAQYTLPEPWTWRPAFWDYLYVSFTNSVSFAPADVLPLRHRMKLLMAMESLLSLMVILIIAARAISILY